MVLQGKELYDKVDLLKQVKVDEVNWNVYYQDEKNGEKWVEEYPNGEHHGGGAPQLRKIDKFPWE